MAVNKEDYIVFDLGSQVPKGASFVTLAGRQAKLLSYGENDLGPFEESFNLEDERYSSVLRELLKKLTQKNDFSLILSLPLHHLVWRRRSVTYRRKPSLEPLTVQELKNLFFYVQSRFLEKIRRESPDLFFVSGALGELKLDNKTKVLGERGRDLEFSIINAFAPQYLLDFIRAAFSNIDHEKISFFVFPLGVKGQGEKLLIIDAGAAKLSMVEVHRDLIQELEVLPLGGLDFTQSLIKKGESLEMAESRKKQGAWPKRSEIDELIENTLALMKNYDEDTQTILSGRSWPLYLEEELRKKLAGGVFWEKELNQELKFFPELPLTISAAMRFSIFSDEDTPQRIFQRIAAVTAH